MNGRRVSAVLSSPVAGLCGLLLVSTGALPGCDLWIDRAEHKQRLGRVEDGSGEVNDPAEDPDHDGHIGNEDCDETNPNRYVGNTEIIGDEIDQDCDRRELCYRDADQDGYSSETETQVTVVSDSNWACETTSSFARFDVVVDCDDSRPTVNPDQTEIPCNGIDEDCDPAPSCTEQEVNFSSVSSGVNLTIQMEGDGKGRYVRGGFHSTTTGLGSFLVGAEDSDGVPEATTLYSLECATSDTDSCALIASEPLGRAAAVLGAAPTRPGLWELTETDLTLNTTGEAEDVWRSPTLSWLADTEFRLAPLSLFPVPDGLTAQVGVKLTGTPDFDGSDLIGNASVLALVTPAGNVTHTIRPVWSSGDIGSQLLEYGRSASVLRVDNFSTEHHIFVSSAVDGSTVERANLGGSTKDLITAVELSSTEPSFGDTVLACDVDGDGFDELLVAAPEEARTEGTGMRNGVVRLYDVWVGSTSLLGTWNGTVSSRMGKALACADLDGDGRDDVIIGAGDPASTASQGAVLVYFGKEEWMSTTEPFVLGPATADLSLRGTEDSGPIGWALAAVPDANGDGYDEVVIGLPFAANGGEEGGFALWMGNNRQ